ncbi:MAG: hypothetical protein HY717_18730 [Planctomycetes bacterium]|nr:hypothetical protein [Planctomycetota bacterium]
MERRFRRLTALGIVFWAVALAPTGPALAEHELILGSARSRRPVIDLTLKSDAEVQGITAAFDWNPDALTGADLAFTSGPGEALYQADVLIARVEPGFMVLGIVIDNDGIGPETIPPGTHVLAAARFDCAGPATQQVSTDVVFQDDKYGTVENGLILDNTIVVGGMSITRNEGLRLTHGQVTCPIIELGRLAIQGGAAEAGQCGGASVVLDAPEEVQGFVVAIRHDPAALRLDNLTTAGTVTEQNNADFVDVDIFPDGGTVGVVLDLFPPLENNTIPPGSSQVIAKVTYCCIDERLVEDKTTPLVLADNVLGLPPKENVIVIDGFSIDPQLVNGSFTCKGIGAGPQPEFRCGGNLNPHTGVPDPVVGFPGDAVELCFYYRSPPKGTPGDTGEDQIQGLSMALCFDPRASRCKEGTFSIEGTITEAVGAEFVSHDCENSTEDGDPGEVVIGILVDALPPFDGSTLPPTADLLKIGCMQFEIDPAAQCGKCYPVEFCDGADGRGNVPIKNLISVNNFPKKPQFFNCEICAAARPRFHRGDCNFSNLGDMSVEISDAAAVISFLFLTGAWRFHPSCLDACDANDDGRVDFADSVFILRYLFKFGTVPPDPGPNQAGPDPTGDRLDCKAGSRCE